MPNAMDIIILCAQLSLGFGAVYLFLMIVNAFFEFLDLDEINAETSQRKEDIQKKFEAQKVADVWKANDERNNGPSN